MGNLVDLHTKYKIITQCASGIRFLHSKGVRMSEKTNQLPNI